MKQTTSFAFLVMDLRSNIFEHFFFTDLYTSFKNQYAL